MRLDPSTTRNLITHVLTICHVKLMQSTALEQKRFDLLSLLPTLHNLWLLPVLKKQKAVSHSEHNSKTQLLHSRDLHWDLTWLQRKQVQKER